MKVVNTNITRFDLLKLNFFILPRLKFNYFFFLILLVVGAIVYSNQECFNCIEYKYPTMIAFAFKKAFLATVLLFLFSLTVQYLTAYTHKNGVLGNQSIEVSSQGVLEKTFINETLTKWQGVKKIYLSQTAVYIQIASYNFIVIPKKSFDEKGEYSSFYKELMHYKNNSLESSRQT
jgi:hypothetical protein